MNSLFCRVNFIRLIGPAVSDMCLQPFDFWDCDFGSCEGNDFGLLLGAFADLWKAIASFIISVRLPVCPRGKTRLSRDGFS